MRKLSVLVIHNLYQQPGGEDAVVRAEIAMLRNAGHRVVTFLRNNAAIAGYNPLQKAWLAASTAWNRSAHQQIRQLIAKERPDIAHCHNLVPLISPAAYYACRNAGVPVVQTLHNYRLLCPSATLYCDGAICDACVRSLHRGMTRGCYRGSRLQTATVTVMLGAHRLCGSWSRSVDAYVALSQFAGEYFVASGLPADKVHVKGNFLPDDPGPRTRSGDHALFVGRLAPEKGVLEMLRAWQRLPHIPLVVAGDGPLRDEVARIVRGTGSTHVKLLGRLTARDVRAQMRSARFLVFPSRWYEPFGMALVEAAACGVPAVASRIGAVPELVAEDQSGLLFDPQNFDELSAKAEWAWSHPAEMDAMGSAARERYEREYTAKRNYQRLMDIYGMVLSN